MNLTPEESAALELWREGMATEDEVADLLEENGHDSNADSWYRVWVNGLPVDCDLDAIKAALRKLKGKE